MATVTQQETNNLILSCSIAALITLMSPSAFMSNGVARSTAFSALDLWSPQRAIPNWGALLKGLSMGSLPFDKEMAKTKLRSGELQKGAAKEMVEMEGSVDVKHLGFEFEDDVARLRRAGFTFEELGLRRGLEDACFMALGF